MMATPIAVEQVAPTADGADQFLLTLSGPVASEHVWTVDGPMTEQQVRIALHNADVPANVASRMIEAARVAYARKADDGRVR